MEIEDQLQQLHERLLVIMNEIHKICEENNIRYSLAGGSLIGAMRHKGFIPWDDDMDIMMPWEDFKRFVDIVFSMKHEWLDFYFAGRTPNYNSFILQAQDRRTTIIEEKNGIPFGLYIDIFHYTYCGDSKIECLYQYYRFKYFHNALLQDTNHYKRKPFMNLIYNTNKHLFSKAFMNKCLFSQMESIDKKRKKYSFDPTGTLNGIVPTECFEGGFCLVPFEDSHFYVLEHAHEYLSSNFGNYMQLPPEDKQKPGHLEYLNLNMPYAEYRKENGV